MFHFLFCFSCVFGPCPPVSLVHSMIFPFGLFKLACSWCLLGSSMSNSISNALSNLESSCKACVWLFLLYVRVSHVSSYMVHHHTSYTHTHIYIYIYTYSIIYRCMYTHTGTYTNLPIHSTYDHRILVSLGDLVVLQRGLQPFALCPGVVKGAGRRPRRCHGHRWKSVIQNK